MALATLTDPQIEELIRCPKRVTNPGSRERVEGKHIRRDFHVESLDGVHAFVLFTRQSTVIAHGFSAGLRWMAKTGEEIILVRCNGADHPHVNALERERFDKQCHIHRTTERYIAAGKRAESHAMVSNRFSTLQGALAELVLLTRVAGLSTQRDEPSLF